MVDYMMLNGTCRQQEHAAIKLCTNKILHFRTGSAG